MERSDKRNSNASYSTLQILNKAKTNTRQSISVMASHDAIRGNRIVFCSKSQILLDKAKFIYVNRLF